jgi:diaminopimelate epimerase
MDGLRFSKWHALGNAYLVLERADAGALAPDRVRRLCDVDIGIGADGVVEVVAMDGARATVVIWNPDGSIAEMSGNGTRIAAAWLAARGASGDLVIDTGARSVTARIRGDGLIEQLLGPVAVGEPETIDVHGNPVELVAVDLGNPHAVVPTTDPARETLLRLGPLIETHRRFPGRTNVQLAHADGRHDVHALVWERGAGETAASGSSAVAVAAVAVALGWCDSPVTVHFPGGDLTVTLAAGAATLVGPAEEICTGETAI